MVPQSLRKFEVLRLRDFLARLIGRQVMGFVEHNQIPTGRCEELMESRWTLQCVNACDKTVVFRKGVRLPVGDIALASEYFEVQMKCFIQLALPVVYQACWNHHQCPGQFTA